MAQISEQFKEKCSFSPALMVSALVDSIPYPLIVRDPEFRVALANRAAADRRGGDLLQCKCYEVQGWRECMCDDCPAREAERTREPVEREVQHPDSGQYYVVDVFPMFDGQGEFCGIIETARDVTERRRNLERIQALLAQVTDQNRELTEWRRSFEYELRAAREIQMMLVPDQPMCVSKVCFDFLHRPSGEVGGDYHDIVALDESRVGVIVSDASGHGVGAALIAVILRMAFRSPATAKGEPAALLAELNDEMVRVVPPGQFATAFYGVFDADRQTLRFASAGHPVPLIARAGHQGIERLPEGGFVLGSIEDVEFEEHEVEFAPGDKLLIYTDGLPDAVDPQGERFGEDRLGRSAAAHREAHGRAFLQDVVRDIEEFMAGEKAADDMTLVLTEAVREEPDERRWLETG